MAIENDDVDLESLVRKALSEGLQSLADVTAHVLTHIDEGDQYRCIGRTAAIVARLGTPRSENERPWVAVSRALEIEDWAIEKAHGDGAE